jgi:predicted nucleic acid-binding protein
VVKTAFFDTSVLLGGLIEIGPAVEPAQAVMALISENRVPKPATAWHCCLEFYSVATRLPPEYRLSPQDTLLLMEEEILGRFDVHQLHAKSRLSLIRTAAANRVRGGRIYDAHIGAVALETGASVLVTENVSHFIDLHAHGIDVLTASEFLSHLDALEK